MPHYRPQLNFQARPVAQHVARPRSKGTLVENPLQHDDEKPLRNQLSSSSKKNWWERRTASPAHDPTQRKSTTSPRSDQRSRPARQEPSINQNRVALVSTV